MYFCKRRFKTQILQAQLNNLSKHDQVVPDLAHILHN